MAKLFFQSLVLAILYQFRIFLRIFTRPRIANRTSSGFPSLYTLDIFASDQVFIPSAFNAYQCFTYIGVGGSFTFLPRLAYSLFIIISSFLIVIPESSLRAYVSNTLLLSYNYIVGTLASASNIYTRVALYVPRTIRRYLFYITPNFYIRPLFASGVYSGEYYIELVKLVVGQTIPLQILRITRRVALPIEFV